MEKLKKFQSWLSAYEKANGVFPEPPAIKFKVKELLKEANLDKATKKVERIYFRDCKWSDYDTLRKELATDKKFVEKYKGVDLKAYIEDVLGWSEKGNTTTENGWKVTLRRWMRIAKSNGKLMMLDQKPKKEFSKGFVNH